MNRQTDMTKLIVAFRNFANAPKERNFLLFKRFSLQFARNKFYREARVCGAVSVMSVMFVVRRVFDRYPCVIKIKLGTITTLNGTHLSHSVTIILNKILEHLDAFSPS